MQCPLPIHAATLTLPLLALQCFRYMVTLSEWWVEKLSGKTKTELADKLNKK